MTDGPHKVEHRDIGPAPMPIDRGRTITYAAAQLWVAYYEDFSDVAVFDSEVACLRHAVEQGMKVVMVQNGSIRDAISRQ